MHAACVNAQIFPNPLSPPSKPSTISQQPPVLLLFSLVTVWRWQCGATTACAIPLGRHSTGKGLQGIISLKINDSTAASAGMHSESCSEYDSAPNIDLQCAPLRLNSSKNRIEQLLETLKQHHVSWHPCIQHFWDMSWFFTLSISTFSGHQLAKKKSPLFNQWKEFLLKFD